MKTDAIIIGAELDGLVAALRLQQRGYSTRIFSVGASSLHYAPGGIHMLGFAADSNELYAANPYDFIGQLAPKHPYRKIGADRVQEALDWFAIQAEVLHQPVTMNKSNEIALSSIGLSVPVLGTTDWQATVGKLTGKKIVIVRFPGHRDFAADPICAELNKLGIDARIVDGQPPGSILENAALAKSFDDSGRSHACFENLRSIIPQDADAILFPAVLGLVDHGGVMVAAQTVLGVPCFEAPTLPPSIPGMRLDLALQHHLRNAGTALHIGTRTSGSIEAGDNEIIVHDDNGRHYETDAIILATGGVLMGGLSVDSYGVIHDTVFGIETFQSEPLNAISVDQSLEALHVAGIETDAELRPTKNGLGTVQNMFVTGRSLAHWNPAAECSADGVCIATGWSAAENAHRYLEGRSNG